MHLGDLCSLRGEILSRKLRKRKPPGSARTSTEPFTDEHGSQGRLANVHGDPRILLRTKTEASRTYTVFVTEAHGRTQTSTETFAGELGSLTTEYEGPRELFREKPEAPRKRMDAKGKFYRITRKQHGRTRRTTRIYGNL